MQRKLIILFIFSSSLGRAMDPYQLPEPTVQMVIDHLVFTSDFKKHLKKSRTFRQLCLTQTDRDENRLLHILAKNLQKDYLEIFLPYCNYEDLTQPNKSGHTPINLVNFQGNTWAKARFIEDCRELIQDRIDQTDPSLCINQIPPWLRVILCCECDLDSDDDNESLIQFKE